MVSEKMLALGTTRSCIRELFEYGLRQAAVVGKENVYDFSIGNPSVPAPKEVNQALIDIVTQEDSVEIHGYPPAAGYMGVREAVADDLNQRYGTKIRPQNLFFTCGAAPALVSVVRALAVDGAEFVTVAPHFVEYRPFVECNGGKLVVVPADTEHFQIPFPQLEARLTSHTQAVIINSPNNPSGVIYTQETLRKLADLLEKKAGEYGHPIYIIADEPYRELVYDGNEVPFIPTLYRNTIVCYSYSKSLSLPGERIGYICVPDEAENSDQVFAAIAGAARAIGHVCPPSLLQRVVARCARLRPDIQAYDRNRTTLYEALTSYGYQCANANGAFYLFVKAPGGSSKAFSERAKAKNLLVVPGDDFGCPEFFRISTCVSHDMILRSLPVFQELAKEFADP